MSSTLPVMTVRYCADPVDWTRSETAELRPCSWSPFAPPRVQVQALWREDALLFRLYSGEAPARAENVLPDSPVYEDSCLECFLRTEKGEGYLNLEGNANGAMLTAFGPDREHRTLLSKMDIERPILCAGREGSGWKAEYTIRSATLKKLMGFTPAAGIVLCANFYVCGDRTPRPCYGAWSPVRTDKPDFHRPEFFGILRLEQQEEGKRLNPGSAAAGKG